MCKKRLIKKQLLFILLLLCVTFFSSTGISQIKFRKQLIASESAESVGVFDVNNDHVLDIVSVSYGAFGIGKGTGIYFYIADLHNTGRKDIIVAGKDGLYVFFNEGL